MPHIYIQYVFYRLLILAPIAKYGMVVHFQTIAPLIEVLNPLLFSLFINNLAEVLPFAVNVVVVVVAGIGSTRMIGV